MGTYAAVSDHYAGGHEGRVFAREKKHYTRDLLGKTNTANGMVVLQKPSPFALPNCSQQRGRSDAAGTDRIHSDVLSRVLHRRGSGEVHHASLCSVVST